MLRTAIGAMVAAAVLAGCAPREEILPGERLDIRDGMAGAAARAGNTARPIALPTPVANRDWTHRGGAADHALVHPALPGALAFAFAADIGEGNSRRARITATPVVAGDRVFTLDASARVSAFSTGGQPLWTRDITPERDRPEDASGGGLVTDGTRVYVSSAFGRLVALDAATGAVLWLQELDAPGSAAPTVAGGLVFLVSRDGRARAIEADSGRVRWQIGGIPPVSTLSGGAGAAVGNGLVVMPFPSGEVLAVLPEGGLTRWQTVIGGARPGQAGALRTGDIAGDPVIAGGLAYVGNVGGRLVALDLATGERRWTAAEGTQGTVWPVAGAVFLVNDLSELVRLDAATGAPVWRVQLPLLEPGRERRQNRRFVHYGPVVAGGRVLVASSDGVVRQFDPVSGAALGDIALPAGAASGPVVAGGTLYVVTEDGQLVAFR
jgi:outer membrane protein assembly factor BamB